MTRPFAILPFLLGLALAVSARAGALDYETDKVQLKLAPSVTIEEIHADYGTSTLDSLDPLYLLDLPPGGVMWMIIDEMEADERIEWAEPSYLNQTPEGLRSMVVGLVGGTIEDYQDQEVYSRLRLGELHAHATGAGAVVAVLDTGVDALHPALSGFVLGGIDYVEDDFDPDDTANGIDDDGDGLTDEGAGHGTMVSGIIHLVAPDAQILPIRVMDDEGHGRSFDVAKGIRYAILQGAHVVNLSLGLRTPCEVIATEVEAAAEAGVVLVAAAGNDPFEDPPFFPASLPTVHGVAALDSADVKTDFSSYHTTVSVSAPGLGILAPFPEDGWALGAGTSFAAPFVAGQAAVILGETPLLTKAQADAVLRSGVIDVYGIPGNEPFLGKLGLGRLDGPLTWAAMHDATAVEEPHAPFAATGAELLAYPNPSARTAEIRLRELDLGTARESVDRSVRIWRVLDAGGRLVRTLQPVRDEAGVWTARWDGRDEGARPTPSGVYFVIGPIGAEPARVVRSRR